MADVLNEDSYQLGTDDEDNCSAVNTHLVDLREAFVAALTASGVLGKLRAQLRASALALLRKDEELCHAAVGYVQPTSKRSLETKLTMLLVHQFLQSAGMHSTAGVFEAEGSLAVVGEDGHVREALQTCIASYSPFSSESTMQAPTGLLTATQAALAGTVPHTTAPRKQMSTDPSRHPEDGEEGPCSVLESVVRDALMHSTRDASLRQDVPEIDKAERPCPHGAADDARVVVPARTPGGGALLTAAPRSAVEEGHASGGDAGGADGGDDNRPAAPPTLRRVATSETVEHARVGGRGGGAYTAEPADCAVMSALTQYEESIPFSDKEGPVSDADEFDLVELVDAT